MTTPYDFAALITAQATTRDQYIADYAAYKAEDLPILTRTMPDTTKINNKLVNDFRGEIVDQYVGYLFGKPVTYTLDKAAYEGKGTFTRVINLLRGKSYDKDNEVFEAFKKRVEMDDLDAETAKRAAIMGVAYRICYTDDVIDEGLVLDVDHLNPWQVYYIDEHAAFLYAQDATTGLYTVQFYDDTTITTYREVSDGEYEEDSDNPPILHNFQIMPVIRFLNNDEELPEFRKVETLIDAYDKVLSDAQNELEEFRLAYMVVIGAEIDADTVALARASGAFGLTDPNADMKFLTKEVNDAFVEHQKQTLRENSYRFSGTVDMTDQKFSGSDQSGEARKWKLLALDNKCAIHERKFKKGLRQMFRVLSTAWQALGYGIDADNIEMTFDRNIPMELSLEADITNKLKGMVTEKTRLSNLSIVSDVEGELEGMEAERDIDLDAIRMNDETPPKEE